MLALFRRDGATFCAVVVVDEKEMIAYGARRLLPARDTSSSLPQRVVGDVLRTGEISDGYGESATFTVPFGVAIYPLPAETVLPWEK